MFGENALPGDGAQKPRFQLFSLRERFFFENSFRFDRVRVAVIDALRQVGRRLNFKLNIVDRSVKTQTRRRQIFATL